VSLLEAVIDRQTNLSTGTKSRVIAQVKREAQQLGVPIPGRSTLYEALGNLHRSKHPFGNATTRRSQANRPDRAWGGQSPSRPGELIEIDSTPLDLMVVFPDGSVGRVDLTAALDIATRTPCAAILRPVATKAVDAAVLLARALTPLPMQPGWHASVGAVRPRGLGVMLGRLGFPGQSRVLRHHRQLRPYADQIGSEIAGRRLSRRRSPAGCFFGDPVPVVRGRYRKGLRSR